jgi:hypothetical protein
VECLSRVQIDLDGSEAIAFRPSGNPPASMSGSQCAANLLGRGHNGWPVRLAISRLKRGDRALT